MFLQLGSNYRPNWWQSINKGNLIVFLCAFLSLHGAHMKRLCCHGDSSLPRWNFEFANVFVDGLVR